MGPRCMNRIKRAGWNQNAKPCDRERIPRERAITILVRMNQGLQFGDPSLDLLLGVPGTGKVRVVREWGPGIAPFDGTAPILNVGGFQPGVVIVGDAPLVRETMGVTHIIAQVHLPDVEVHELTLMTSERHGTLLRNEGITGVLLARRDVLEIVVETRLPPGPQDRLSPRAMEDGQGGTGGGNLVPIGVQIHPTPTILVGTVRRSQMLKQSLLLLLCASYSMPIPHQMTTVRTRFQCWHSDSSR
jgi:hypothetical protein